ncbi:hypothetical protein BCR34DRAFT_581100 [Clohesyomyces aquaticus]|uniref:Uncharacterized protein n=1 Tax=Clohesyomyces aquaticus TaxID=1231657 RepID=A0A1Y1Y380_9PLEO|nr:hypothetical protein BCR34DRAFT_581100 [Clohesyomyces aquaticus]
MRRSSSSQGSSSIPNSDVDDAGPARGPNRRVRWHPSTQNYLPVPQPNNESDEEEDQVDARRLDAALFLETPRLGDPRLATTLFDQYSSGDNRTVSMATIDYDHPDIVKNPFPFSNRDVDKNTWSEQAAIDYEVRPNRDTKGGGRSEGRQTGRTSSASGDDHREEAPKGSHESQSGSTGGKDSKDDGDSDDEKGRKGKEKSKDDGEEDSSEKDDSEDEKTPEDSEDDSYTRSKQPVEQEPHTYPVAEPRQSIASSLPPLPSTSSQRVVLHDPEPREHGYGRGEFRLGESTYSFVSPNDQNVLFRLTSGGNAQQPVPALASENRPTTRPDSQTSLDNQNVGPRPTIDGNAQQSDSPSVPEHGPTTRVDFEVMAREYLDRGREVNEAIERMLTALGRLDTTMRPWRRLQEDMTEFLRNIGDLDTGARGRTRKSEEGVAQNVDTESPPVPNQQGGISGHVGAGELGGNREAQEVDPETREPPEPAQCPDQGLSEEGEADRETERPPEPAPYPDQGPLGEDDEPHEHFFGFRY